jgi:CRP-like cAMP-binding protein
VETVDPARLKNVEIFSSLTDEERVEIATWLEIEDYPAGKAIIHDTASGYVFFVLDEGQVRAERAGTVLEVLQPGSVFGEMAILNPDGHRTADVVAETAVRVFSMFGTRFRQLQLEHPAIAERLRQLAQDRADRLAGS